jgi:chromosome segregation ATPase
VFELLSQVESINKEKLTYQKQVEKLEHSVSESSIRIEELTRQVNEVTSIRVRLTQENSELLKEIHEIKVHLDNANHLKTQLATQLEDSRRRLEDEERVCFQLNPSLIPEMTPCF